MSEAGVAELQAIVAELPEDQRSAVVDFIVDGADEQAAFDVRNDDADEGSSVFHWGSMRPQVLLRLLPVLADLTPAQAWRVLRLQHQPAYCNFPSDLPGYDELWSLGRSLQNACSVHASNGYRFMRDVPDMPFATLRGALAEASDQPDEVLLALLFGPQEYDSDIGCGFALTIFPGYGAWAAGQAPAICELLRAGKAASKACGLTQLQPLTVEELAPFAPLLAEFACQGTTGVQRLATPLLLRAGGPAAAALRQLAEKGKPKARERAVELLAQLSRDDESAKQWLASEAGNAGDSEKVAAVVKRAVGAAQEEPLTLPPATAFDWHVEPGEGLDAAVRHSVRATLEDLQRMRDWQAERGRANCLDVPDDFSEELLRAVHVDGPPRVRLGIESGESLIHHVVFKIGSELGTPPMAALLKIVYALAPDGRWETASSTALHERASGRQSVDLRSVAKAIEEVGSPSSYEPAREVAVRSGGPGAWEPDAVWPWVAENDAALLEDYKASGRGWRFPGEDSFFGMVGTLPQLTPTLRDGLFAMALGGVKADRVPARRVLGSGADVRERVEAALSSSQSGERLHAATWLGELGDPASLPALEKAVSKEKHEAALGALIDSIQRLGGSIDAFVGREQIAKDATKTAKKPLPPALDWLVPDALPALRWSDGEAVTQDIVLHLLTQAVKAKSSAPGAVLGAVCERWDAADREAFGLWLLDAWIAADTQLPTHEQADAAAQQSLASEPWLWSHLPEEERYPRAYQVLAGRPVGSATASRGVLAVVAACARRGVAERAGSYIRTWYGQRASQCKALVELLAQVDDPAAIQQLLTIGTRFRTKSIQDAAREQTNALAERRGWTMSELADRTLPTAGFSADGLLELPYAEDRVFTARLLPDLTVELADPDGKTIKSLPTPRQSDDGELAAESKKELAAARKEVKAFPTFQAERLHQALCLAREWPAEDWQRYLAQHPLMRFLLTRLVWVATSPDGSQVSFRPLEDGSYTDVDDNPVELDPEARVALAYDGLVSPELAGRWSEHLRDFDVEPLFPQFGREHYGPSEEAGQQRAVTDYEGHLIGMFSLRGRATKLGYDRGEVGDGGFFYDYRRSYPELDLVAKIQFTGCPQPIEDGVVALTQLTFARPAATTHDLPLSEIPPVLLTETWNDLREIASQGSGSDPEWEKKVTW